jgi:hypothetical protein
MAAPNTTQTTGCHSGEIRLRFARGLAARYSQF